MKLARLPKMSTKKTGLKLLSLFVSLVLIFSTLSLAAGSQVSATCRNHSGLFTVFATGNHGHGDDDDDDDEDEDDDEDDDECDHDHKVTICHRTNSVTNPYVKISVDKNAADGVAGNSGHKTDHFGEHPGPVFDANNPPAPPHNDDEWGDIIPPLEPNHSGLNWTAEGIAIYNYDCKVLSPSPSPTWSPLPSPEVSPSPEPTPSPIPSPTPSPEPSPSPSPEPSPSVSPSPSPSPSPTIVVTQTQTNSQTVNVLGATTPTVQPETGVGVLGLVTVASAAPLGIFLTRFRKGIASRKEENLSEFANGLVQNKIQK